MTLMLRLNIHPITVLTPYFHYGAADVEHISTSCIYHILAKFKTFLFFDHGDLPPVTLTSDFA